MNLVIWVNNVFPVIAIIAIASIISLLGYRVPRSKYIGAAICGIAWFWVIEFICMIVFAPGIGVGDAVYWIITMSFGAEPLKPPPPEYLHGLLLTDAVVSFVLLALVVTIVVEKFTRKAMEDYTAEVKGLRKKINWVDHIVLIGWSRASEYAYRELKKISPETRIVVVVEPDRAEEVWKVISGVKESVRGGFTEKTKDFILGREWDCVIGGDPCSEDALERACVWRAKSIVISLDDDSRSAAALLQVKHVIARHREEVEGLGRKIYVVVEALRDENEPLLRSAGYGEYIKTVVVISRSLVGRLLASCVIEPSVVAFLCDATSATYGITAFREIPASRLTDREIEYGVLQEKLLREKELGKRMVVLSIIRSEKECRDTKDCIEVINNPDYTTIIKPSDKLIVLCYEETLLEKGSIDLGVERGFMIESYEWFRKGSLEKLWSIRRSGGHITVVGWTEASESFISEVVNTQKRLEYVVDGELAPGETINKTIIALTQDTGSLRNGFEDIVVVTGDPTNPRLLRRAGVLSADVIVTAIGDDPKTTHTLLHIRELFSARPGLLPGYEEKVVIAETELSMTQRILIDNKLVDVAIASRSFSGRLLAYAALDPSIYGFIEDIASATTGELDLREIVVGKKILGDRRETRFIDLFRQLKQVYKMTPIAVVTRHNGGYIIVHIPFSERIVREGDRLVVLSYSRARAISPSQ